MSAFSSEQIRVAKLLANFGEVYIRTRGKDLSDNQFKSRQKGSNHLALDVFVSEYAFERAGPVRVYKEIALNAIQSTIPKGFKRIHWTWPDKCWEKCREIQKQKTRERGKKFKLNTNMYPLNTEVIQNNKLSVLSLMKCKGISNLAIWCRDLLADGETSGAYETLRRIKGVADKIASLYLRDVSFFGQVDESTIHDPHLLQPIDTWVRICVDIIRSIHKGKVAPKSRRQFITDLCRDSCSAIKFNMGAWLLGRQIARSTKGLKSILIDKNYSIIRKRIREYKGMSDTLEVILADLT